MLIDIVLALFLIGIFVFGEWHRIRAYREWVRLPSEVSAQEERMKLANLVENQSEKTIDVFALFLAVVLIVGLFV